MKAFFRSVFLTTLCFISFKFSQSQQTPTGKPESRQFDFWVGDWELTWNDTSKGSNNITLEMNNLVVYEHFKDPASNYFGWSWSVYDTLARKWKQTWVDNQGEYLDFTGQMADEKMVLERSFTSARGTLVKQRMTFYNITKNNFDWNWENSTDGGTNWKLAWKIHYQRKKPL